MVSFGYHWKDEPAETLDGRPCGFKHAFWLESPEPSQSPSKEMGKAVGGAGLGEKRRSLVLLM